MIRHVLAIVSLALAATATINPDDCHAKVYCRDRRPLHRRVSNIAIYLSTSFAENTQAGGGPAETYVEARGRLVALWAAQVARLTLVTDALAAGPRMDAFVAKHRCAEGGTGGDGAALRCGAWGGARVLVTPCSAEWFGTAGPCCKVDHALVDFFRDTSGGLGSVSRGGGGLVGVEWLMYSDDDLFVRPRVLQAFLSNFDHDLPLILGANNAAPRFRGSKLQVSWNGEAARRPV
jgi:hypothetical protein